MTTIVPAHDKTQIRWAVFPDDWFSIVPHTFTIQNRLYHAQHARIFINSLFKSQSMPIPHPHILSTNHSTLISSDITPTWFHSNPSHFEYSQCYFHHHIPHFPTPLLPVNINSFDLLSTEFQSFDLTPVNISSLSHFDFDTHSDTQIFNPFYDTLCTGDSILRSRLRGSISWRTHLTL